MADPRSNVDLFFESTIDRSLHVQAAREANTPPPILSLLLLRHSFVCTVGLAENGSVHTVGYPMSSTGQRTPLSCWCEMRSTFAARLRRAWHPGEPIDLTSEWL